MKVALLDDDGEVVDSIDVGSARVANPIWRSVQAVAESREPYRGVQFGNGNTQVNRF